MGGGWQTETGVDTEGRGRDEAEACRESMTAKK